MWCLLNEFQFRGKDVVERRQHDEGQDRGQEQFALLRCNLGCEPRRGSRGERTIFQPNLIREDSTFVLNLRRVA